MILDRAAAALALALPLFLLHGRGIAEVVVALLGVLFLLRSTLVRDWAWLRQGWVPWGLAWWAWLVACSVPAGWAAAGQAAGVARFLLLVAALEHWALRDPRTRLWLVRMLQAAALYIALHAAAQFLTGRNLFGWPRGADGELTGPYMNPRAGPPFVRLLFPSLLPVVAWGSARLGWRRVAALGLGLAAFLLLFLMGQRMPLLLGGLGLLVTGLLLPRLRLAVVGAAAATCLALLAGPLISPEAYYRLVTKFTGQMAAFPVSHYGLIAARAVAMVEAHPLTGLGFDGFRWACDDPQYFLGWRGVLGGSPADDLGGGTYVCVQHPHNFYLQALVEGGVPGLALFCALVLAWLRGLSRGLWRHATALRAGLFIAALLHLWPLASTTAFTSMPLGGWAFLLLGLGLAEARAYMAAKRPTS